MVIGGLGAALGAFGSYRGFEDVAEHRARHKEFQSLATSKTVGDVREAFNSGDICSEGDQKPWCKYESADEQAQRGVRVRGADGKNYLFPAGTTKKDAISYFRDSAVNMPDTDQIKAIAPDHSIHRFPKGTDKAVIDRVMKEYITKKAGARAVNDDPNPSSPMEQNQWTNIRPVSGTKTFVNKGGIRTITWADSDFGIEEIETKDGKWLSKSDAQSFWMYLLHLSWPVLGFFAPWGVVRTLGWVAVGFQNSPK